MIHGRRHRGWRSRDRNRKTNRKTKREADALIAGADEPAPAIRVFRCCGCVGAQMMVDSSPAAANSYATLGTWVASLPPLTSMSVPVM